MPKQFFTENDIDDLFKRGTRSLQVTDDVVLTELAYERAKRLGLQLVTDGADNPPAAPVRPYLSDAGSPVRATAKAGPIAEAVSQPNPALTPTSPSEHSVVSRGERESSIEQRIRSAVVSKLGDQVDAKLLDNIIHRVVKGIGLK